MASSYYFLFPSLPLHTSKKQVSPRSEKGKRMKREAESERGGIIKMDLQRKRRHGEEPTNYEEKHKKTKRVIERMGRQCEEKGAEQLHISSLAIAS